MSLYLSHPDFLVILQRTAGANYNPLVPQSHQSPPVGPVGPVCGLVDSTHRRCGFDIEKSRGGALVFLKRTSPPATAMDLGTVSGVCLDECVFSVCVGLSVLPVSELSDNTIKHLAVPRLCVPRDTAALESALLILSLVSAVDRAGCFDGSQWETLSQVFPFSLLFFPPT